MRIGTDENGPFVEFGGAFYRPLRGETVLRGGEEVWFALVIPASVARVSGELWPAAGLSCKDAPLSESREIEALLALEAA